MGNQTYDVIFVDGGNAALCAALAASEQGAKVALLERAPKEKRGGNSRFTGGGFRMVHHGGRRVASGNVTRAIPLACAWKEALTRLALILRSAEKLSSTSVYLNYKKARRP